MEKIYFSDKDGNHFYKKMEYGYLHVLVQSKDVFYEDQILENLVVSGNIDKGDTCINNIPKISKDCIEISEELFNEKIREAIFNLGIYELSKSK